MLLDFKDWHAGASHGAGNRKAAFRRMSARAISVLTRIAPSRGAIVARWLDSPAGCGANSDTSLGSTGEDFYGL